MKRIKITLSDSTVELLEKEAALNNISKSNYIGILIQRELFQNSAKYDGKILEKISDIDADLRALICRDELSGVEKLKILEYAKDIKDLLKEDRNGVY